MKKLTLTILLFSLGIIVVQAQQIDRSQPPKPGPAPEINIGKPASFTLANGLKVFVVENHKIPRISASLILKLDPVKEDNKAGYIQMAGELMRRGTTDKTKAQLDETIDYLGGSVNTGSKSAYASSLTDNFDKLFSIFADVVLHPSFPEDQLAIVRKQTLSSIASEKDDPSSISSNVADVLDFGLDHPYGEIETDSTVKNIKLQDIKDYYNTYWKPNVAYLALVGDIDINKAKALVSKYFGNWKKADVPAHNYDLPKKPDSTYLAIVDRPAAVQSNIDITDPIVLKPGEQENFPAMVMNEILGGGSNSRLFMDLREKHGYTYGAYSSISNDPVVGSFSASAAVRNEVTDSALIAFIQQLNDIRSAKVSADELDKFKNAMSGSFARSLENPAQIAHFALNIELYNMPEDYYQHYLQSISQVTTADVEKAAQQFINPENANIVIVGNASDIVPQLKKLNYPIRYYDIYGNRVEKKAAPVNVTAEQVINNYLKAIGGRDKLEKVKDLSIKATADVQGRQLQLTRKYLQPGDFMMEVSLPAMNMTPMKMLVNGDSIAIQQMGQAVPVSDEMKQRIKSLAKPFPELDFNTPAYQTKLKGEETINGKDAYAVAVTGPDSTTSTYYFDAQSGFEVRVIKEVPGPKKSSQSVDMSDYREVSGIKVPYNFTTDMGPQKIDMNVQEVKVNSGLKAEDFK